MIEYITWFTFLQYLFVFVNGEGFGVPVVGKREVLAKHPLITNLHNYENINFYGYIWVGTPIWGLQGQKFEVMFDTGSSDLVVVKKGYKKKCNSDLDAGRKRNCDRANPNVFDPSKSATREEVKGAFSVSYVDGTQYTGHTVLEYVEIGEGESKTRVLVPIGLADVVANDASVSDGVMGLGFGIGSNSKPQTLSPLECIFTQTDIPKQLGYYVQRDETTLPKGSYGGEIYFGGHNPKYIKSAFTEPVPVKTENDIICTWSMIVKSIAVGADEINLERNDLDKDGTPGTLAIPDTGTVDLVISEPIYQRIKSHFLTQVPESKILFSDIMFLCGDLPDTLPDITFVVNDKVKLTLGPQDYIEVQEKGLVCRLAITGNAYPKIILGNVFLSKYYTVFDYGKKEMKFALSTQPNVIDASRKQQGQMRMRSFTQKQLKQYRGQLKNGFIPAFV